ncbi:MAG TPA: alanine racemase [Chitinophagales bacterium]|nr:alanine racemase [Chitinophagales bacterium]
MNKRKLLGAAVFFGLVTLIILLIKPKDKGATYSPYFRALNQELKTNGPGRPVVIVDLDLLDSNIAELKRHFHSSRHYRVVDKSLPSYPLLSYIMRSTATKRVMCFHQPYLNAWVREKPDVDLLLGKPMPLAALETFYNNLPDSSTFNPAKQVQWLIDSKERLLQYLQFAKRSNRQLQINIEIDVGLHRGGLKEPEHLGELLAIIQKESDYLSFTGFMGYDAHVPEVFFPLGSPQLALQDVIRRYSSFVYAGKKQFPDLFAKPLTFNGAGSKTYQMYDNDTILNDLAAGSGLLLPSDFDVATLKNHRPAVFIATPVLKREEGIKIPFLEFLEPVMRWWNPNLAISYFIYGGRWKAKHYSPAGLQDNSLYGFSSNQQIVNGAASTELNIDDYIFLRPTQSEAVMLEFGNIYTVRNGKLGETWKVFEQ